MSEEACMESVSRGELVGLVTKDVCIMAWSEDSGYRELMKAA